VSYRAHREKKTPEENNTVVATADSNNTDHDDAVLTHSDPLSALQ